MSHRTFSMGVLPIVRWKYTSSILWELIIRNRGSIKSRRPKRATCAVNWALVCCDSMTCKHRHWNKFYEIFWSLKKILHAPDPVNFQFARDLLGLLFRGEITQWPWGRQIQLGPLKRPCTCRKFRTKHGHLRQSVKLEKITINVKGVHLD